MRKKISIFSFFSGIGILDLAFEKNGYTIVFVNEYDRDVFRIGFLGNKESDWIKLQQFRTKGQQWYRFDLGNTVGYVSLSDVGQRHIQEISSRLDISANETSEAFKLLINVVFNYLFYTLNRKANDLIKTILAEEGLLEENLSKRVKKNDAALREMIQRNKRMQKALADVSEHLQRGTQISGTDQVALPQQSYAFLTDTFKKLDADIKADSSVQESTAVLLSEADAQLKAIEVESYNNYKLMANGLITETITHELHSLSKTGIAPDASEHFDFLKDYFVRSSSVRTYNQHVVPIKNSYSNISGKLNQIGSLYSFLETTFIKKGTYDEFIHEYIRQEESSLPVLLNKGVTGHYLSFRSVPIPEKNNRKNWCWIVDASELNRVLNLLKLPALLNAAQEIVLKNESTELNLEQSKKVRIVKARQKIYFEFC